MSDSQEGSCQLGDPRSPLLKISPDLPKGLGYNVGFRPVCKSACTIHLVTSQQLSSPWRQAQSPGKQDRREPEQWEVQLAESLLWVRELWSGCLPRPSNSGGIHCSSPTRQYLGHIWGTYNHRVILVLVILHLHPRLTYAQGTALLLTKHVSRVLLAPARGGEELRKLPGLSPHHLALRVVCKPG